MLTRQNFSNLTFNTMKKRTQLTVKLIAIVSLLLAVIAGAWLWVLSKSKPATSISTPKTPEVVTAAADTQPSVVNIINDLTDVPKIIKVLTYEALTALSTPAKTTIYRVENDSKHNIQNSLFIWWNDGKRLWIAATDDN